MHTMESDNKKELLSEVIEGLTKKNKHDIVFAENNEFSYTWEIRDFQSYYTGNFLDRIESPMFKIGYYDISLKLNLDIGEKNSFYISFTSPTECITKSMHFTISIIDNNEKENIIIRENCSYISTNFKYSSIELVEKDFVFDEKNGWLPNGNLIIKCVICFQQNIVYNYLDTSNNQINTLKHRLKEFKHFEQLLDTGKYSDVKLVIEDKEFQVHKCILTMFSPVFTAMFEHNMKEKNDNIVEITDVKYEVIKEVLSYIYTGRINNFLPLAKDILAAADKYEINELKKLCEDKLVSTLSNENVEEMLILSDLFNANNLKKYILEFMTATAKDIIKTESFKNKLNSVSEPLVKEMFKILALKE